MKDWTKLIRFHQRPSCRYYAMIEHDGQWFQSRHQTGFDGKDTNTSETRGRFLAPRLRGGGLSLPAGHFLPSRLTPRPTTASAWVLLATGAIDRAPREIEAALRLNPGLDEARRDLAAIRAAKGGRQ